MENNSKILNRIIEAVSKTSPESEIYLYGSRARGDSTKLSDWDLLILLNSDHVSFTQETTILDNLFDVELELDEVISPIVYSKQEWVNKYEITPLFENIAKEGVRIK